MHSADKPIPKLVTYYNFINVRGKSKGEREVVYN